METKLPILPEVLEDEIQKMACIKKSNGKEGNNFVIIIQENAPQGQNKTKAIRKWLFSRLENIKHKAVCGPGDIIRSWNVLIDTDDTEESEGRITVYIHTNFRDDKYDESGLIIKDENPPFIKMSSNYILEYMGNEPECVVGIGINAVSNEYMAKNWWEQRDPLNQKNWYFCPAFCTFKRCGDDSESFGWKNYPPVKRSELLSDLTFRGFIDDNFPLYNLNDQFKMWFEKLIDHGNQRWGY